MDVQCFKCGRALSHHLSVQRGIGPICFMRQEELDPEEKQRQLNLQCQHGFSCHIPEHASVTLARFQRRFEAMADQTSLPDKIRERVPSLIAQVVDALGMERDHVAVPMFGRETIAALHLPACQGPGGLTSCAMPVDHDEQYRRVKLRALAVCPFGLDCREPMQAVAAGRLLPLGREPGRSQKRSHRRRAGRQASQSAAQGA